MKNGELSRILVVEDDPILRRILTTAIEKHGWQCFVAFDRKAAIDFLSSFTVELVITDMVMPIMDGLTMIEEMRRKGISTPIIAMSSSPTYLQAAELLDIKGVYLKSLPFAELRNIIEKVLNESNEGTLHSIASIMEQQSAKLLQEEANRIESVTALNLADTTKMHFLDAYMEKIAKHFKCSTAIVSIVTKDRQFWSSYYGIAKAFEESRGSPRSVSICTHAVASKSALVVQDALNNPIFRSNPFVQNHGLRFYAGVPIFDSHGLVLGTLCIIDSKSRIFSYYDLELLSVFSKRVTDYIRTQEAILNRDTNSDIVSHQPYYIEEIGLYSEIAIRELLLVEGCRAIEKNSHCTTSIIELESGNIEDHIQYLNESFRQGHIGLLRENCIVLVHPTDNHFEPSLYTEDMPDAYNRLKAKVQTISLEDYPGNFQQVLTEIAYSDMES